MDKINITCPNCKSILKLSSHRITKTGKKSPIGRCGKCGEKFKINLDDFSIGTNESKYYEVKIKFFNPDDYRVLGEKKVLYISLVSIIFIFFILFKISYIAFGATILFSIALVKISQGRLLGQSVKVSEHQLPDVYQAAKIAANRLCMKMPDVFVRQNPVINAGALGFGGKKSVVLNSKTVESMNEKELISILGHEFSHIRCDHTNWNVIANSVEDIKVPIISDVMGFIFLWWSRKAEFTADRGGLLASRSLKSSIASLSKVAVGEKLYYELDINKFFEQEKEVDDDIISKLSQVLSTHPYTVKRLNALTIFYKSEKYKFLIETGYAKKPNDFEFFLREIWQAWCKWKNGEANSIFNNDKNATVQAGTGASEDRSTFNFNIKIIIGVILFLIIAVLYYADPKTLILLSSFLVFAYLLFWIKSLIKRISDKKQENRTD